LLVLVAEPTVSGLSDFARIADLCDHMKAEAVLIINRWDVNPDISDKIEKEGAKLGIECLGRIPYDEAIPHAVANAVTPVEWPKGCSKELITDIWGKIEHRIR
jgi:MinD superfamily P-loop ATPase